MYRNYAIINIIFIVIALLCRTTAELTVLFTIQIILNSLYLLKNNRKYFSVGFVFFILLCLFHYGKYTVFSVAGFDIYGVSEEVLYKSLKFAVASISAFLAGYFAYHNKYALCDYSQTSIELSQAELDILRKVSVWIIIITLFPFLYTDYIQLKTTYSEGYIAIYSLSQTDPIVKYGGIITPLTRPAILLLMLSYFPDKRKAGKVLFVFSIYLLFSMFSGARMTAMIYLISALLLYCRLYIRRINTKYLIGIFLLSFLFISLLPVITKLRGYDSLSVSNIQTVSEGIDSGDGKISSFFDEFGGTMISLVYAVNYTTNFNYGLTYLFALLGIPPKIPSFLVPIVNLQWTFVNSFPPGVRLQLGGSILGESYFNFGWMGILFLFFIGRFVSYMDRKLANINSYNLMVCILLIALLPNFLGWVRGYCVTMINPAFWTWAIYYLAFRKH